MSNNTGTTQVGSSAKTLATLIENIALRNIVNPNTGTVRNMERVVGYVAKINTEGDLAGTIDVQEFGDDFLDDENIAEGQGYHEGVYLSAIQDNSNGMIIIPRLYSEVVIVCDPATLKEYVCMYSHVQRIQLDSHEEVHIGVAEREEFDLDDEEGDDISDLALTGNQTGIDMTKDTITTQVADTDGNSVIQTTTATDSEIAIGETDVYMSGDGVSVSNGSASHMVTSDEVTSTVGGYSVKVTDSQVYVGGDSGEAAVLGVQLASILSDMLGYLGQLTTTTMMGPQPPINFANFIALKAKVDAYKASTSGFLSKSVIIKQ
jgi:hypothetical protein